jgi:PH (Pleckstrin Homology) domain-containing protein
MPAVSEPALPHTWRPLGVRVAIFVSGGLLLVVCVAAWVAVGPEVRARVSFLQNLTLVMIALMVVAVAWALARCRVTASRAGIEVVNGFRVHHYEWAEVLAVHMPPGAPFAVFDLADGTSRSALGIQGSDGDRARTAVLQLRMLVARTAAESLKRPDPPAD